MLVAISERHSRCRPRPICLQLNPIAHIHPGILLHPLIKCPFLLPLLLPFPFAPLPSSPSRCPLLHLPLQIAPLHIPLPFVPSQSPTYCPPPVSPTPPHSFLCTFPTLPSCPHSSTSPSPLPLSQSPHPRLPIPVFLSPSPYPLLPVHPPLDLYLHLNQDMLHLLLSFCSFTHLR